MAAPKRKPNPIRERLERAQALDLRRQQQIANQSNTITRLVAAALLPDDERPADVVAQEIATLNEQLAIAQRERDEALEKLATYEAGE